MFEGDWVQTALMLSLVGLWAIMLGMVGLTIWELYG